MNSYIQYCDFSEEFVSTIIGNNISAEQINKFYEIVPFWDVVKEIINGLDCETIDKKNLLVKNASECFSTVIGDERYSFNKDNVIGEVWSSLEYESNMNESGWLEECGYIENGFVNKSAVLSHAIEDLGWHEFKVNSESFFIRDSSLSPFDEEDEFVNLGLLSITRLIYIIMEFMNDSDYERLTHCLSFLDNGNCEIHESCLYVREFYKTHILKKKLSNDLKDKESLKRMKV
ncbi:hypothetical protein [Burkholderia contaminans]|uniref:hypothetical protein n=1 Tax=Burkholderia contaminans TaxID=488447 RepID=UPI0015882EC8|nr:hypothetical protein [Burkholderia contaminans]